MNNCGLMYESGFEGTPANLERASAMYKQAHKLGNLDATINLAFYYLNVSEKHTFNTVINFRSSFLFIET